MAGYIGTKAVNLSTTGADIAGDADVSGALDVGGAFTSQGIDDNATSTAITIDSSENVGIGTDAPNDKLTISGSAAYMTIDRSDGEAGVTFRYNGDNTKRADIATQTNGDLRFTTNLAEAMRITSAGQTLIGRTATSGVNDGHRFDANGFTQHVRDGGSVLELSRETSDGDIQVFKKGTTTVGSIGTLSGDFFIASSVSSGSGLLLDANTLRPMRNGALADNIIDLGGASQRFDDIYATNGTIQTSDRNEKQDIAELSDAEQRVAVAAKGLLRKFRWRDAVAEKGDEARTHFGIIAQDLQAAFAAEGLDAGRYAMFMSNTWWETQTEVPAVEAVAEVLDEDGSVVTEAVEAVDAYTRTDTYGTQEEAPEGATERTRLGVRYSELLAFIIGAL